MFSVPLRADEIQIGSGTGKQYYLPSYSYYMYSLTQQLYTAEELGGIAGGINSIAFYNDGTTQTRNFDIYMVNTNKTCFSSRTDWVPVTSSDKVFSGNVTMTKGTWTTITFTTPFDYDGTNIAIMVDDNTNSASSSGSHAQYLTFNVSNYQSIYAYSDGTNYDPSNPPTTGYSSSFTYQQYKNQIKIDIVTAPVTCAKPSGLEATNISAYTATLDWTKGSEDQDTWEIYLTDNANDIPNDESEATISENVTKPYTLTSLTSSTTYYAYVRANCGSTNGKSKWSAGCQFATTCIAITEFPFTETFDDLTTNGEIPMCWNNEEGTTTNENYRWCYNSTYGTGHSGKCVRFDSFSNTSGNTNFLKTPVISLPQSPAMQLRFWYKNPKGGDFSVFISTDGGQTHETALATGMTNIADWTEKTLDLSDYKGEDNVVIVFKGTSNYGSNDARIYLDDVNVELAPTCPKQNALHVTELTSSSVTLDWTAGNSEQDHWDLFITTDASVTPDANTTPTVTNTNQKPYTHTGLSDETIYFVFVRARCSDTDQSDWTDACRFVTPQIPVVVDGEHPYSNDFETNNGWLFVNGDRPNQWWYGSAANNTPNGSKAIYISNDGGVTNSYTSSSEAKGVVYATKAFTFAEGVYSFTYDWRAKGNQYYDFIRVALVPASYEIVATDNLPTGLSATSLPNGWIALDGGSKLINSDVWNTQTADEIQVAAGDYKMVFVWRNLSGAANQPPAAIDNISISYMTCPRPTNLTASDIAGRTATLTWTENGTATNWVLQYATNNSFTENLVETNVSGAATMNLSGLTPETTYYARVKSILGNEESSWSDVCNFTTTATCEKPTLSYVTNSNTAHSGAVSWTGNADNYELIYSTKTSFEPGEEGVIQIDLGNVNTYTLQDLTPETTYRIKVRANCGADDGYSQWSNQVSFTTTATCVAPSGLSATATSSTITLNWTAGAQGQDAWDIRYKTGTNEYTYIHLDNQTTTSYTITGLNPVTTYSVNVRAYCSEEDQSKWGYNSYNQNSDLSITTECGALSLPYSYGFEDNLVTTSPYSTSNPYPNCWSRIAYQSGSYGNYTYYPFAFTATSSQPYAHGGNGANSTSGHCLRFYQTSSSTNECAVLPEISSEYNMNSIQIRFWGAVQSSQGTMQIGIMESLANVNTFTPIQEVNISNTYSTGFQEFTIPFTNYTGNGRYIAFMCGTGNSYAYFLIDDITVEIVPTCFIPNDLEANEITENEATLVWTPSGNESAWNIQYKKASDSEWSDPIAVEETTYTLTGLQRATAYEARVQANCAEDDQSDWTNPISFQTDCGIWTVDGGNAIFEDFENVDASDFPPTCWDKFSHEMSGYTYWYLNSNNGLGSSAAYSYWNEGYAFLVMPKMHINGNATLSFDYLIGSGDYDESCSVVVSTNGLTYSDFSNIVWAAAGSNSGNASATVSLSDFDGRDIYIAFKFKGLGTSGCTWYVDNVQVYVADKIFATDGDWNVANNWQPEGVPAITESVHINAAANIPNDYIAIVDNITIGNGSLTIANGGQLKHNNEGVQATVQKTINGYTGNKDNYYLIASPMAEDIALANVSNLTSNDYDLYLFDQSQELEWRNQEDGAFNSLNNTVGYLYANSQTVTLGFNGELMPSDEGVEVPLLYDESSQFAGWNLIGNPFACDAYLNDDLNFYKIDGTEVVASNKAVSPMEGIFVEATSESQNVTFYRTQFGTNGKGVLNLNAFQSGNRVDLARIRFSEGRNLSKFMLHRDASRLYIPQEGREYAVVHTDGIGELPVNFKATENGTYTINVSTEDVEMSYLHLIDNLTGEDVNLMESPSYSFEAKTTDYASRFRLVFSTISGNSDGDNETFAFFSNGKLIVLNEDQATLQVIDMIGRVLSSETLSGNTEINLNQPAGIYMLRLVNGENVKTQKIVVR